MEWLVLANSWMHVILVCLLFSIGHAFPVGFEEESFLTSKQLPQNNTVIGWTVANGFPQLAYHRVVVFNDNLFSVAGDDLTFGVRLNTVYVSANALDWSRVIPTGPVFEIRSSHTATVFGNTVLVIAGFDGRERNDVWGSTNDELSEWNRLTSAAPFPPRDLHATFVLNGKIWIIGGNSNSHPAQQGTFSDVWSSANGFHWTQKPETNFPGRYFFNVISFQSSVWFAGGCVGNSPYTPHNDVWRSADGIQWVEMTQRLNFTPKRLLHGFAALGSRMYIVGGASDYTMKSKRYSDSWSSADGMTWTAEPSMPCTRDDFALVTFANRLWVLGGRCDGGCLNTIAYFQATATVNCVGHWNLGTQCSVTCDNGVYTDSYEVTTPAANTGKACEADGATRKTRSCSMPACPSSASCIISDGFVPGFFLGLLVALASVAIVAAIFHAVKKRRFFWRPQKLNDEPHHPRDPPTNTEAFAI